MAGMRSFHFFSEEGSPPEKTAADYSEAEKTQFKKNFEPTAKNYRRFSKIVTAMFLLLGVLFLIFFILGSNKFLPEKYVGWVFIPWGSLLLISIVAALVLGVKHDPACPACKRGVGRALKTFCPECGSNQFVLGSLSERSHCSSCKKSFISGGMGGRSYKIRFCTHCGILLDDKGI
jgi:hypothetical protein